MNQLELFKAIINFVDQNRGATWGELMREFPDADMLVVEMVQDGELREVSDNPLLGTYKFQLPA